MKKPFIVQCCVCKKIKVPTKAGEVRWLDRSDAIIPGYSAAMAAADVSHGYCFTCKDAELAKMGVTA